MEQSEKFGLNVMESQNINDEVSQRILYINDIDVELPDDSSSFEDNNDFRKNSNELIDNTESEVYFKKAELFFNYPADFRENEFHLEWYSKKGKLFLQTDAYKQAFRYYLLCIETNKADDFDILYVINKLIEIINDFYEQKNWDMVLEFHGEILRVRELWGYYNNIIGDRLNEIILKFADIYMQKGDYNNAIIDYEKSYGYSTDDEYPLYQILLIGDIYDKKMKNSSQAVELYKKVRYLSIEGGNALKTSLEKLISIYRRLEQYDKAIELCIELIENYPNRDIHSLIKSIAQEQTNSAKAKLGRMIASFSHSLANTLAPQYLEQVIDTLKNHTEFSAESLLLAKAWRSEILMRQQAKLLEMKHRNSASFKSAVWQSFIIRPHEKVVTFPEMLNWATERVVERLLNEDYQKLDKTRNLILNRLNKSLEEFRKCFETEVFFEQSCNALTWANQYLPPITYSATAVWQTMRVKKESAADALLNGYFAELLLNALKYHQTDYWAKIEFRDDDTYLIMTWQNCLIALPKSSEGRGLNGIRNDLQMLNEGQAPSKDLETVTDNSIFEVTLYLTKPHSLRNTQVKEK